VELKEFIKGVLGHYVVGPEPVLDLLLLCVT